MDGKRPNVCNDMGGERPVGKLRQRCMNISAEGYKRTWC